MYNNDELYHHGVLGQKWGVRRYQNSDGSLTAAGKEKYRVNSAIGNIGRAITNTTVGQRLIGVGINRGYRQDRKEIKNLYKSKKDSIKNSNKSDDDKKTALKSLKSDYRKTKGEARVSAAQVLYPWQDKSLNERIQTQNFGKQYAKSILTTTGYGGLTYDRVRNAGYNRGASFAAGFLVGAADAYTSGLIGMGDYTYNRIKTRAYD